MTGSGRTTRTDWRHSEFPQFQYANGLCLLRIGRATNCHSVHTTIMSAKLLAILQVEKEHRVQCQEPGCAHGVYRAIHVIDVDGALTVLGSTCFAKRFGNSAALGTAKFGNGQGRRLDAEERQMLVENTAALLDKLQAERDREGQEVREKLAKLHELSQRQLKPRASQLGPDSSLQRFGIPWEWAKPLSSVAYLRMRDGTSWVRVMHRDSSHILMPWPYFDGWDEAYPAIVGTADYALGGLRVPPGGIVAALEYLKDRSQASMQVGIWREVVSDGRQS
jgi:hypothetical protein